MQILYSVSDETLEKTNVRLQIYLTEIKVSCLINCHYWEVALQELVKFDDYLTIDKNAGLDLINFFKLTSEIKSKTSLEKRVLEKIQNIIAYPF